jgi:hypothetical protein
MRWLGETHRHMPAREPAAYQGQLTPAPLLAGCVVEVGPALSYLKALLALDSRLRDPGVPAGSYGNGGVARLETRVTDARWRV